MKLALHCLLVLMGGSWFAAAFTAADAEPTAQPAAADAAIEEIPALPYLTLMLVRDAAVQQELRLTDEQLRQLDAAIADIDHPMWLLRDVPVAQCREQLDKHLEQLRGRMQQTLTSSQIARFDQIVLQARGHKALAAAGVAERLELSPAQVRQIRDILVSGEPPAATTANSAEPDAAEPDVEKTAAAKPDRSASAGSASTPQATWARIQKVLTAAQTSKLAELAGAPFDLTRVRRIGCQAPELRGVEAWINAEPFTLESQRGKVVVVHFWAYGCINCVRNLPHYQAWHAAFPQSKVSIVGLHTPETEREKVVDNIRQSVRERGIEYPVAIDAGAENWKAWGNHLWPSVYLVDKQGRVRYWWYGELTWQGATGEQFMRQRIEALLAEE